MGKKSGKYLTNEEYEYLEWRFYNGMEIDSYFDDYSEDGYVEDYEEVLKGLIEEEEEYIIVNGHYAITSLYRGFNIKKRKQMTTNFSSTSPYLFIGGDSYNMQKLFEEQGWKQTPTKVVFQSFLDKGWSWRSCYTAQPKEEQIRRVLGL